MIISNEEMGSGIKLLSTIARAEPLPTATWLGTIKKNIAAAAINAPTVIIIKSITAALILIFGLFDII